MCVELPRDATGVPQGRTSVNLSGPPLDVRSGACVWDVNVRMDVLARADFAGGA